MLWVSIGSGYLRELLPDDLRQAVIGASQKYPGMLLRRVLNIDPWRLNRSMAKKPAHAANRKKQQAAIFKLPIWHIQKWRKAISESTFVARRGGVHSSVFASAFMRTCN
jgi:hypothetical protein